jgi:recombination protein RecT
MAEKPKHELAIVAAKPMFLQIEQGDELRWNKEMVFALQVIRGNDSLQKCTDESIKNSIVNLATIGITLNPALALAYLVPRGGKCVLDISYRGMVRIATDSGSILDVDATVVYENDSFEYEMGLTPKLSHKPCMTGKKGEPVYVYAVAVLHNGMKKFIVLDMEEIEKVRSTSKARTGPWTEWLGEMMRKTAVKKLFKLLPQSEKLNQAVAILNEHEGLDEGKAVALAKDSQKATVLSRFMDAEVVDESTGEVTDVSALQTVYRMLADLSKLKGDSEDDLLAALTGQKYKQQQDLEAATPADLVKLQGLLQKGLDSEAGDLFDK